MAQNTDILEVFSTEVLRETADFLGSRKRKISTEIKELKIDLKKMRSFSAAVEMELALRRNPHEDDEEEGEEEEQQGHYPAASSSAINNNNNNNNHQNELAPSGAAEELFLGAPPIGMMPKSNDYTNDGHGNGDYTPTSSDDTSAFAGPLQ
eukprot:g15786.t1